MATKNSFGIAVMGNDARIWRELRKSGRGHAGDRPNKTGRLGAALAILIDGLSKRVEPKNIPPLAIQKRFRPWDKSFWRERIQFTSDRWIGGFKVSCKQKVGRVKKQNGLPVEAPGARVVEGMTLQSKTLVAFRQADAGHDLME